MAEIKSGAEDVRWDLKFLYSGVDDPKLGEDDALLIQKIKDFNAEYKGKLAEKLGKAIADYTEIKMLSDKIQTYLFLEQSRDTGSPAIKAKAAEVNRLISQASGEYLAFFDIELVALSDSTLEKFYVTDPFAAKHRPWIDYQRIFKPHLLSEPVESALTKRAPFGEEAWSEFFDELEADLEFAFNGEKKTLTEMLNLLSASKDAAEREGALKVIDEGLIGPFAKYSAQTLYMVIGSAAVERMERKYKHSMEARNKLNRVADETVDALHKAVEDVAGPLNKRFYRLKAAHLGLDKLKWSDRNAPLPFADTSIVPFEEAIATVLAAYESFSPTLAGLVKDFISKKRIDAPAVKGKRGGAYNSSLVLPGNEPASLTFLNYLGSNRDVTTLAHELGHGVHGILAGAAQGALMAHPPIAYCETASVFGEMTTFNFLKERLAAQGDKKSQLALLMEKIEGILNTIVRQIGFSNFERRLHGMDKDLKEWKEPGKLSVEEVSGIWMETIKSLYGEDGEIFTYANTEHLWAYISHFHRPFYVYGYAFGELLTQSLYAKRKELGERFEPLYLELLRSGSTKTVTELLEPFGLNPADEKFWADGIQTSLGALIAEAEKLSAEMGISV
ncbi:MAG: oligoendopeptidase F [Parcubacteria group bacterium LiPW_15]|nr:MAG: oligoendopeptidase F [Parcubacteria group bacterium LiPW_15]